MTDQMLTNMRNYVGGDFAVYAQPIEKTPLTDEQKKYMDKTGLEIWRGDEINVFDIPMIEKLLKSRGANDPNSDGIVEGYTL